MLVILCTLAAFVLAFYGIINLFSGAWVNAFLFFVAAAVIGPGGTWIFNG